MNFKQRSRSGFKEKSSDLRKVITVSGCMFLLLTVEGSNLWANSFMNPSQQVIKLSSKMQDVTVQEVLASVEQQTDYHFTYNPMQIGADRRVTIDLNNKSVTEILDELFLGKKVQYVVEGNNIVLFADNKKAEVKDIVQQKSKIVTGTVLDVTGMPVIGANVTVKGTTQGTITDMDGKFSLEVAEGDILQVTYIGFANQEVKVGTQTNLSVTLKEDAEALDELVVVGYGTQKKVNLTGAVTAITGEKITKRPVTNTTTMLQGQVPGLRIVQGTGQPGAESVSVKIRGVGTFSGAGASPLVLINGVTGDLSSVDPNMIESVSVLKDAASAAIYGARAANGVILITTKQGADKGEKVSITYRGNFAVHTPTKMFDLVTNSADYMTLFNQAKINSGESGLYPEEEIEKYRNSNGSVEYPSFDWLGYMFNPAFVHQHNLSLAGTAKKTTYNIALNYADQDGTLRSFKYKKYNVTVDLTTQATNWMKVGFFTNMMKGDRNFNGVSQDDAILSTMSQAPTYMPWLPDDGTGVRKYTRKAYENELFNKNMPMIVEKDLFHQTNVNTDINAQLWLDIQLTQGLTWYTKGAVRQVNTRNENWRGGMQPTYNYHTGELIEMTGDYGLSVSENRTFYTNLYTYLKYDYATPNRDHNFSLMVGYSQETNKYETLEAYRRDYDFDLPTIDAGAGSPNWSNSGKVEEWALMSGFFRLNYNYKDRYLFEANARYDGSSRLSPDGRWGVISFFIRSMACFRRIFYERLGVVIKCKN